MRYGTAAGVVLFFFAYFVGFYRQAAPSSVQTILNQKAPTFTLPEVRGGEVDSESFRGRPVLLVFWNMLSAECRQELTLVSKVAPDFRSKCMAVVAIHVGDAETSRTTYAEIRSRSPH